MPSFYNQSRVLQRDLLPTVLNALKKNKFILDRKLKLQIKAFFLNNGLTVELANSLVRRLEFLYSNKISSLLKQNNLKDTKQNINIILSKGLTVEAFKDLGSERFTIEDRKTANKKIERNFYLTSINHLKAGVIDKELKQSLKKYKASSSKVLVLYIPSSADNNRLAHERYYNKVMSLRRCVRIQNVPNCQCGYVVLGRVKEGVFIPKGNAYKKYKNDIRRLGARVI